MPVSAETLRLLMDAGIDGDDLLRIVESIDKTPAKERSANAERQARWRARQREKEAESVTNNVTDNVTEGVTPRVRVEDNPSNQEITGKKGNKKTAREHLADFKAALSDLGDERLEAFVLHRKAKRGALTGYGAKLFLADCEACDLSPSAGADMAMSRGWITVRAEWLQRSRPNSTAPPDKPKKITHATMWHDEARNFGILDDPSNPTDRRVVESLPGGQNQGAGLARRYAGTGNG